MSGRVFASSRLQIEKSKSNQCEGLRAKIGSVEEARRVLSRECLGGSYHRIRHRDGRTESVLDPWRMSVAPIQEPEAISL